MRSIRLAVAFSIMGSMSIFACTSDDSTELPPGVDAGSLEFPDTSTPFCQPSSVGIACHDAATPPHDAGADTTIEQDSSVEDSTVADTNQPDTTQADTNEQDTNQPDTNQADTNQPDTNQPDTNVPDTNVPDVNVPDVNVPDTNVPDVFDAGCVVNVFGDHYIRNDGTVASMKTTPHSVVYDSTTGTPLKTITEIVEQSDHACGLRDDGTVWCWPFQLNSGNGSGDLGNGHFNGNQLAYFATEVVTQPSDAGAAYLTSVTAISTNSATGYTYPTCAIRKDRSMYCWGFSTAQGSPPAGLFYGTTGSTNSVEYAIPMALSAPPGDGGAAPVVHADKVAIGDRHGCYVDTGKVYCWGSNIAGNLGTGDTNYYSYPVQVQSTFGLPATVDEISCAYDLTCARGAGKVWCWGTNGFLQTGNSSLPQQICNSNYCQPVPTPVDYAAADGGTTSNQIVNTTQITGGYQSTCALDNVGSIWCWGATAAGVGFVKGATPYTPNNAPYTNVAKLSAYGGGINDSPRYLTTNGTLVSAGQVVTPLCP